jgi:hypothetical protein
VLAREAAAQDALLVHICSPTSRRTRFARSRPTRPAAACTTVPPPARPAGTAVRASSSSGRVRAATRCGSHPMPCVPSPPATTRPRPPGR